MRLALRDNLILNGNPQARNEIGPPSEVLCKLVAHNLCGLIMSKVELGIDPLIESEPVKAVPAPEPVAGMSAVDFDPADFRFSD